MQKPREDIMRIGETRMSESTALRYRGSVKLAVAAFVLLIGGCAVEGGNLETETAPTEDTSVDVGVTQQGLAESTCGHSICNTGAAVSASCHWCVASICRVDPFCCATAWDSICVGEVTTVCHLGLDASTRVSSIKVHMQTGGDDLRGGSQAYGSFQVSGGGSVPSPHAGLNMGAGFPAGSVNTAVVSFSPPRTLATFTHFTLEWDGAPRNFFDTYDNWDANEFRFSVESADRCPGFAFIGAPIHPGRMTGSRTITPPLPVHFP